MRPSALILCMFVVALAACAERALGPADVSGVYGLLRYDNDTLPRTYSYGTDCRTRIESGWLALSAKGTFQLDITRDRECGDSCPSWSGIDAAGTYGAIGGNWLAFRDSASGTSYLGRVRGTHVVMSVPQVAQVGGAVDVEFAAQAGSDVTAFVPSCMSPPPPDTVTISVITKRP